MASSDKDKFSSYNTTEQNIEAYREALANSLDRFKSQETIALKTRELLESYSATHKQLNKRFATALQDALGEEYSVYYGKDYSFDDYSSIRIRETVLHTNSDGTQWRQAKYDDDYLSIREIKSFDDAHNKLSIYIETENTVMHAINEQKRLELANINKIAKQVAKAKAILQSIHDTYTDKARDYGKMSYAYSYLLEAEMHTK